LTELYDQIIEERAEEEEEDNDEDDVCKM